MQYKYFHNEVKRVVCKISAVPRLEKINNCWYASTDIVVTRADNILSGNRWLYAINEIPSEYFELRHPREDVISFFLSNIIPEQSTEISEAEYELLYQRYEREARSNSAKLAQ